MKKRIAVALTLLLAVISLCGCGEEPIDPSYTDASVIISSFTEIAGENPDRLKTTDSAYCYTYEVKDGAVGAAAYDLYKKYLDENFSYSMTESTVIGDNGYRGVYYAENGEKIEYSEAVDKDGAYTITVSIPK